MQDLWAWRRGSNLSAWGCIAAPGQTLLAITLAHRDNAINSYSYCEFDAMSTLDHQALHQLYNENNSWLKGWLRARLGNAADASDLAHDTFLRVMTARSQLPIREPRSYLSAIARSLLIDKVRRRAIEKAYLQALALRPAASSYTPFHSGCTPPGVLAARRGAAA